MELVTLPLTVPPACLSTTVKLNDVGNIVLRMGQP